MQRLWGAKVGPFSSANLQYAGVSVLHLCEAPLLAFSSWSCHIRTWCSIGFGLAESCILGKSSKMMTSGARCHAAVRGQQCSGRPSCHACTLVCSGNSKRHHSASSRQLLSRDTVPGAATISKPRSPTQQAVETFPKAL